MKRFIHFYHLEIFFLLFSLLFTSSCAITTEKPCVEKSFSKLSSSLKQPDSHINCYDAYEAHTDQCESPPSLHIDLSSLAPKIIKQRERDVYDHQCQSNMPFKRDDEKIPIEHIADDSITNEPKSDTITYDFYTEEEIDQIELESNKKKYNHLVIVPGHAIFLHNSTPISLNVSPINNSIIGTDKYFIDGWILESYQRTQLSHFIGHLKAGINLVSEDPNALLVISGGQTRPLAGPISEAASYFMYASQNNWFNSTGEPWLRVITEEYAQDSYQNLINSICRFYEFNGKFILQDIYFE